MEASLAPEVESIIEDRYGPLTRCGAGAWSTAFRFRRGARDLVIRVGPHLDDFLIDAEMAGYASDAMPIPQVIELDRLEPPHDDLHVCISSFAHGRPLETVDIDEWRELVPSVVDLLETLRATSSPSGTAVPDWPTVLLARDDGDGRLGDWQQHLDALPEQRRAFDRSMQRLEALCDRPQVARVEPTLLHCDLINRNVHVEGSTITGVFDWGCRRWGDHLYDLAWFEFWAPWFPNLDIPMLRDELIERWGHPPDPDRLTACLVHIGADHLVYNAAVGDDAAGSAVLDRINELDIL